MLHSSNHSFVMFSQPVLSFCNWESWITTRSLATSSGSRGVRRAALVVGEQKRSRFQSFDSLRPARSASPACTLPSVTFTSLQNMHESHVDRRDVSWSLLLLRFLAFDAVQAYAVTANESEYHCIDASLHEYMCWRSFIPYFWSYKYIEVHVYVVGLNIIPSLEHYPLVCAAVVGEMHVMPL